MERILLVDDERDALEVLTWVLTDWGYSVETALTARDAIEVGLRLRPTVVISDYYLPSDVTGLELMRTLRAKVPSFQAILMTGLPLEQLRRELGGFGEIKLVRKPFRWSEFQKLLTVRPAPQLQQPDACTP